MHGSCPDRQDAEQALEYLLENCQDPGILRLFQFFILILGLEGADIALPLQQLVGIAQSLGMGLTPLNAQDN